MVEYIQTDIWVRFQKLRGHQCIYLCADDTHGTAIMIRARQESRGEEELIAEAHRLMPLLPFEDVDILVIDRIGKNISGSGMDPNVTGRHGHGYNSHLREREGIHPDIRRIFVRNLTPQSHGNAVGIGMADVTTQTPGSKWAPALLNAPMEKIPKTTADARGAHKPTRIPAQPNIKPISFPVDRARGPAGEGMAPCASIHRPVSYTHLTLPTILLV